MTATRIHAGEANDRLTQGLIALAVRGERPRCSDPVDDTLWTSDDHRDRTLAIRWCNGCPILVECRQAARCVAADDHRATHYEVVQ
jgi:hypothetical protein